MFTDELKQDFGGRYKRSDCVVNCRVASIIALCGCMPFFLPKTNIAHSIDNKQLPNCSMENLTCLNHYRSKFNITSVLLKILLHASQF